MLIYINVGGVINLFVGEDCMDRWEKIRKNYLTDRKTNMKGASSGSSLCDSLNLPKNSYAMELSFLDDCDYSRQ